MYKIKTFNQISVKGLERFTRAKYEVGSEIGNPDAILLRSHKLHNETLDTTVLAVARAGAGVNNVPVAQYSEKGIVVFNTPGANANAVKELVLAGLLLGSRGIKTGIDHVKTLHNVTDASELHKTLEAQKKQFAGNELMGKTLGIVGLGAIGSLVADMALALGMKVVGYDPALSIEAAWRLSSNVQKAENLHALLARCDYVSLHVPAIEATHHLINKEALAQAKSGMTLVNFARESIVDPEAIVAALDNTKLKGYICDFPEPVFYGRSDVIAMPHIGASTAEAEENCAIMAAEQIIDYLENGNIKNSVNFPAVSMARCDGQRIIFSNNNVPKVLGNVLSVLADNNVNVIDMVNKSRGDLAYNILDVEQMENGDVIQEIANVEHVKTVRLID
ncbi:3-phosphoglycerate dehydrogenase family protein [Glaciecola petra]|uniref:D-3-phosphoglycerate dehydrogenase n=1 Tax=Glaciecola petra TaxID=3075602 RepID=A0ABU2ZUB0_9ALTE|nr:3-phosphoglycerate dehydrogenase family protein [Aestuariibacter sp. P117]MDT0595012.1 3-phosphoglycerate dehydrogenase family protein [Aestuariibacter sp. P117]